MSICTGVRHRVTSPARAARKTRLGEEPRVEPGGEGLQLLEADRQLGADTCDGECVLLGRVRFRGFGEPPGDRFEPALRAGVQTLLESPLFRVGSGHDAAARGLESAIWRCTSAWRPSVLAGEPGRGADPGDQGRIVEECRVVDQHPDRAGGTVDDGGRLPVGRSGQGERPARRVDEGVDLGCPVADVQLWIAEHSGQ